MKTKRIKSILGAIVLSTLVISPMKVFGESRSNDDINYTNVTDTVIEDKLEETKDINLLVNWDEYRYNYNTKDYFPSQSLEKTMSTCIDILKTKPLEYTIKDNRLLDTSRAIKDRIVTLTYMYRYVGTLGLDTSTVPEGTLLSVYKPGWSLSGRLKTFTKYKDTLAQRAVDEMLNAVHYKDWHPSHYLDTAELMSALGIGYNWLEDYIVQHGYAEELSAGIANLGLATAIDSNYTEVFSYNSNWNNVCNSGASIAALAIYNNLDSLNEKGLTNVTKADAASIISRAIKKLPIALKEASGGVYPEGIAYWGYSMAYTSELLSSLDETFGTTFGLLDYTIDGTNVLKELCYYPSYTLGSSNLGFNYGDSTDKKVNGYSLFWFANKYQDYNMCWYSLKAGFYNAYSLLWYTPQCEVTSTDINNSSQPKDKLLQGTKTSIAVFRDSYEKNTDGTYVAIKAGKNGTTHGDLDAGTFVLDALGVRWAKDFGAEPYSAKDYFVTNTDGGRWKLYGKRAEGNNTLSKYNNPNPDQNVGITTTIDSFVSNDTDRYTILDLTNAFDTSVKRGIKVLNNGSVLLQDEIDNSTGNTYYWNFQTDADITIDPNNPSTAILCMTKSNSEVVKMQVDILANNNNLKFTTHTQTVYDTNGMNTSQCLPRYKKNAAGENVLDANGNPILGEKLAIEISAKDKVTVAVLFTPLKGDNTVEAPEVKALDTWGTTDTVNPSPSVGENNASFGADELVQSIGFGNGCWSGYSDQDHTEESYKEISELGFNTVRFYMSCTWFEDKYNYADYVDTDGNCTYPYKESGWEILDKNIKWAKKYGIKLILNLHVPAGGFQSRGEGMTLWFDKNADGSFSLPAEGEYTNNQMRTRALWTEIAKHYGDEDTIIAFDLINEPYVPLLKADGSLAKSTSDITKADWKRTIETYPKFAATLIQDIRKYDTKHTMIVENTFKTRLVNTAPGKLNTFKSSSVKDTTSIWELFDVTKDIVGKIDNNYGVEFHCYYPYRISYMYSNDKYTGSHVTEEEKHNFKDNIIANLAKWRDQSNVPIFLGEFGYCDDAYEYDNAGAEMTEFIIQTCKQYNINYSYHQYHGAEFGLYPTNEQKKGIDINDRNETLAQIFAKEQHAVNFTSDVTGNGIECTIALNGFANTFTCDLDFKEKVFEITDIQGLNGWEVTIDENNKLTATSLKGSFVGTDIVKFTLTPKSNLMGYKTTISLNNCYANKVYTKGYSNTLHISYTTPNPDGSIDLPSTGSMQPWFDSKLWVDDTYFIK